MLKRMFKDVNMRTMKTAEALYDKYIDRTIVIIPINRCQI